MMDDKSGESMDGADGERDRRAASRVAWTCPVFATANIYYAAAAYCYRRAGVVCLLLCWSSRARTGPDLGGGKLGPLQKDSKKLLPKET